MNKLLLIGCLAIAVLALLGAGAMVVSETSVNAEATYNGAGSYQHQASMCELGDPGCPPNNQCSSSTC
jgi:hypothetical protein